MSRVILIAGPTASGKSSLSIILAARYDGVIINADSMQVYDGLNIISARPPAEDLAQAPHKLYGHIDPAVAYNTADWAVDAMREVDAALDAGKTPILVGGTGMYFKTLLAGMAEIPEIPDDVRAGVRESMAETGPEVAHAELTALDPITAERLAPGDSQRIARALEVVKATGKSITEWQADTKPGPLDALDKRGQVHKFILSWPREELYARCNLRFDMMLDEGGLDEIKAFMARGLPSTLPSMRALGVPTLIEHLKGECSLDDAIEASKMQTRRFAKRQLTYFRNQFPDWNVLNAQQLESELGKINNIISKK